MQDQAQPQILLMYKFHLQLEWKQSLHIFVDVIDVDASKEDIWTADKKGKSENKSCTTCDNTQLKNAGASQVQALYEVSTDESSTSARRNSRKSYKGNNLN